MKRTYTFVPGTFHYYLSAPLSTTLTSKLLLLKNSSFYTVQFLLLYINFTQHCEEYFYLSVLYVPHFTFRGRLYERWISYPVDKSYPMNKSLIQWISTGQKCVVRSMNSTVNSYPSDNLNFNREKLDFLEISYLYVNCCQVFVKTVLAASLYNL